jgi:hypothetical protein
MGIKIKFLNKELWPTRGVTTGAHCHIFRLSPYTLHKQHHHRLAYSYIVAKLPSVPNSVHTSGTRPADLEMRILLWGHAHEHSLSQFAYISKPFGEAIVLSTPVSTCVRSSIIWDIPSCNPLSAYSLRGLFLDLIDVEDLFLRNVGRL